MTSSHCRHDVTQARWHICLAVAVVAPSRNYSRCARRRGSEKCSNPQRDQQTGQMPKCEKRSWVVVAKALRAILEWEWVHHKFYRLINFQSTQLRERTEFSGDLNSVFIRVVLDSTRLGH
jgi:hypothetical protein